MQADERSSYLAAEARAHDRERYVAALFAPAARRETVLALIALNHELARVPSLVSAPMAGMIRYQWWRDALDEIALGRPPRQHPVVMALADARQAGWLDTAALQQLVDARERELEAKTGGDVEIRETQARDGDGLLQAEIHRALGGAEGRSREAARAIGTGLGLVGYVRDLPAGTRSRASAILDRAVACIAEGRAAAGRPPRSQLAAFLPGRLATAEAARLRGAENAHGSSGNRPASAPLGLLLAWLAGRP